MSDTKSVTTVSGPSETQKVLGDLPPKYQEDPKYWHGLLDDLK